jgi:arginine deiminase
VHFRIDSEYGRLETVLVHRPGLEIDRLTHDNIRAFLFEDVPYLRRIQDEHDEFVGRLREHGIQVIYLGSCLADILQDPVVRQSLVGEVCITENVPAMIPELASPDRWEARELCDLLFAGITSAEFTLRTGRRLAAGNGGEDDFLLPPIPNAYFSRDPAVIVRDAAISSKMHFRQRVRETLLIRAILEEHPEFRDNPITYGGSDEPTEDRPYTIEGGDVIVLSAEAVLIGASERTRSETIERLASKCFRFGRVQRVYEIPVPTERAFMHLDTVFTVLDRGKVLWYPEVVEKIRYLHRFELDPAKEAAVRVPEQRSFAEVLRDEFGTDLTIIRTAGGRRPHAAKEQRMDGANVLAIGPSLVVTYERNEYTTRELEAHGVQCVRIRDSELVRGLGGPRCMTMPLRRSPLIQAS